MNRIKYANCQVNRLLAFLTAGSGFAEKNVRFRFTYYFYGFILKLSGYGKP